MVAMQQAHASVAVAQDAGLVERLKRNDSLAWEQCYDAWYPRMYAYAYRRTGDPSGAADIASEVFLRALRDIGRYEDRGLPLEAWLYRIAHARTADHLRHRRRHPTARLDAVAEQAILDGANGVIERQAVMSAIQQLTDEQQDVVLLRFYHELPAETVAKVLGRNAGAVRALQFRALRRLRTLLSEPQGPAGT